MKISPLFDAKMRAQNWRSLDAARAAIAADPLTADYILENLTMRRVVAVQTDGSVRGVPEMEKVEVPKGTKTAKEWGASWPEKWAIMEAVGLGPVTLSEVRQSLAERGAPSGHWVTLHALWRMMKDGYITQVAKGYASTMLDGTIGESDDEDERRKANERDYAAWLAAFRKAGAPYRLDDVIAALEPNKRQLNESVWQWELDKTDPGMMNTVLKIAREKGDIPPLVES